MSWLVFAICSWVVAEVVLGSTPRDCSDITKDNDSKILRHKLECMTTSEIDEYARYNYLDEYTNGYSREYKINKIVEKERDRW